MNRWGEKIRSCVLDFRKDMYNNFEVGNIL